MNASANAPATRDRSVYAVDVDADAATVWRALTDPLHMARWLGEPEMRVAVEAEWRVGGVVRVRGHHHADFVNAGRVLVCEPPRALAYTQLSSISRLADTPENHTTLAFVLTPSTPSTTTTLTPASTTTTTSTSTTTLTVTVGPFANFGIQRHWEFYWQVTVGVFKRYTEEHRAALAISQDL